MSLEFELLRSTWLVTGGCGFIGSEFLRQVHAACPHVTLVNADALSYAASPERLASIDQSPRYKFIKCNIAHPEQVQAAFDLCGPNGPAAVVNFAAESHVDRSLFTGVPFVMANTLGVQVLLETARTALPKGTFKRFLQVSTDEVYGDVEPPRTVSRWKRTRFIRRALIRRPRRVGSCWWRRLFARSTFRRSLRGARTIMVRGIGRRRWCRSSSCVDWREKRCRCMGMGCSGGTGFTWRIMRRGFWRRF